MRYWITLDKTSAESYSHNLDVKGMVEITQEEFEKFISSLNPKETISKVDELAGRVDALESKVDATAVAVQAKLK
jgi:hypothetical protein